MSIQQYGKSFPVLLRMQNPRGNVELLETIGKGNYGYVYKGKLLKKENEIAAVKVVFLKEDEIKETLLEMEILQACNHPNITQYYGCFLKGLDLWICMEFCGAGAVDSLYRTFKKPISEDAIAAIIYETLLALEYLHTKAALIHRDIKAGNLLLTIDGKVKLADFGVSAQLKTIGGRANTFIGTPYWMAPEVILCDPENPKSGNCAYTDKSDIWSIGITAIEISEKNPPLSDIHPMQALNMIPKSDIGLAKPKNFSKQFVEFVNFLLIKNPEKRPSATHGLAHPLMVHASNLDRDKLLAELVKMAMKIKDKKKAGLEITAEDEEEEEKPVVSKSKFTLKQTSSSMTQITPGSFVSSQPLMASEPIPAPSISEFPTVLNNVQEGITPVFEPVILTTLGEILTADVLDGQYILIGTERGLSFLDIQKPSLKIPIDLIPDIRFRQIQVLQNYNVLIAISGKHDHVRQYSLASLRKLILIHEGNEATLVSRSNTDVPIQKVELGKKVVTDYDRLHSTDFAEDEKKWITDYVKIPNTRDAKSFSVEQTETTAYLCILGQVITLFRWAVHPYGKFMKLKSYWVPEPPKFISISQDGISAIHLYVGYSSELNRVTISDSKVSELSVHKEMKTKSTGKSRWQSMLQIPFSDTKLEQILRENAKGSTTTSRKLAAVTETTLKRTSTITESYFLGTYHKLTKVVDEKGYPMIGAGVGGWKDGVMWSEPPVCQILRPLQNVISVGKNNIEIVDWKTAALRQRLTVDSTTNFRILCSKHGHTLLAVDKKKKGSMLYWMRESSPSPRSVGSILETIANEQASVNLLEQQKKEDTISNMHRLRVASEKDISAISPTTSKDLGTPGPSQGPPPDERPHTPEANRSQLPTSPSKPIQAHNNLISPLSQTTNSKPVQLPKPRTPEYGHLLSDQTKAQLDARRLVPPQSTNFYQDSRSASGYQPLRPMIQHHMPIRPIVDSRHDPILHSRAHAYQHRLDNDNQPTVISAYSAVTVTVPVAYKSEQGYEGQGFDFQEPRFERENYDPRQRPDLRNQQKFDPRFQYVDHQSNARIPPHPSNHLIDPRYPNPDHRMQPRPDPRFQQQYDSRYQHPDRRLQTKSDARYDPRYQQQYHPQYQQQNDLRYQQQNDPQYQQQYDPQYQQQYDPQYQQQYDPRYHSEVTTRYTEKQPDSSQSNGQPSANFSSNSNYTSTLNGGQIDSKNQAKSPPKKV